MVDGGAIIDVFANSINVGSGFRLRCKWNRFLFMTEYRTDGRRSVSAGHSSLLPFSLSLSVSVSSPVRLYVALLLPWNLSFFSPTRNTGGPRKRYTLENDESRKLFVTSFRYIDTLFERIVGLRENSWHESIIVGRWGKLGWSVLLEDRSWASSSWISCRVVEKVFFPFFFYIP